MKSLVFLAVVCLVAANAKPFGGRGMGGGQRGFGGSSGGRGYEQGGYNRGNSGFGQSGHNIGGSQGGYQQDTHGKHFHQQTDADEFDSHSSGGASNFHNNGHQGGGYNNYENGGHAAGNQQFMNRGY